MVVVSWSLTLQAWTKRNNLNITLLCGASKEALKAFVKPLEASQRNVKIKIEVFTSVQLSEMHTTGRVNIFRTLITIHDTAFMRNIHDTAFIRNTYDTAFMRNIHVTAFIRNIYDTAFMRNVYDTAISRFIFA